MDHSTDILLVTATEIETQAVLELAQQQTQRPWTRRALAGQLFYELGVVGGAAVCLVQSEIGAIGVGASAQTVEQGIAALRPIAVIMLGIAFGMREDTQRVGDVLVARQLLLYEPQRVGADAAGQPQIRSRGARADVSPWLLKAFRSGCLDWRPATAPPALVHTGLILSGEKLVDSQAAREQLRQIEPEAIGGEMEGAGLYVAAQYRKVDWILVKAICDWADGHKADCQQQRQRLAAQNAAHFVLHVIQQGGITRAAAPLPHSPAPAAPQGRPPALHQLRAPVDDFVGRAAALAQLSRSLCQAAGAALVGIQGMGGVGKTELAYVAAARAEPSFPDAQIVLDLRGTSASPLTPEQALQTALRAFLPLAPLPEDLPALEACYRTQLHGRRVLILADDARDAAQVRALIPPAGCALLITSRTRFVLPGMSTLDLEQLAAAEAAGLLQRICPRLTPDTAALLARACAYLPLALRISGSLLHTLPALSAADYLAALGDVRQRLQHLRDPDDPQLDVAAALALSYAQLDAPARQVFCQLGVLAGGFATGLAQAVLEPPDGADTCALLHQLLRRNLILYDPARARWCLHDLVRDLALQQLERQGMLAPVAWRYAQVALQIAQTIGRRYRSGGPQALAALDQFDAEQLHIQAGYTWALAQRATPEGARLLLALVLATAQIGELRLDARRRRIPRLAQALEAARRAGRPQDAGQALLYLGRAVFDLGSFRQAVLLWERALALFRQVGDRQSESLVLGNIGTASIRLGDPWRAAAAYQQALGYFSAAGDQRREAHALGNLGALHVELGDLPAAVRCLGRALTYARAAGDLRFEGTLLDGVGRVLRRLGAPRRALAVCRGALAIARKLGDRQQEGYALITLGRVAAHLGESAWAAAVFDQALVCLQTVGDRWGLAECRWYYGVALAHTGDRAHALPLLQASVAYRAEIGYRRVSAQAALLARLQAGDAPAALTAA